jgi:TRAP-type C4-dicarboxylate transport system substrate-binding protein
MSVDDALHAYEDGRIDGFMAPPSVALAFQWTATTRYVTDLRLDYLTGCLVIAERAFDPLPRSARDVLRAAVGKFVVRFSGINVDQDALLLGGLFARQGVKTVPVDPSFATEFYERARATREKLDEHLVPHGLLARVLGYLADLRVTAQGR